MEKVLTPDQENAEKLIKEWFFNTDNLVFVLEGYAGTGKTFMIDRIVRESLHLKAGTEAVFVMTTGKAATVLIKNGTVAGTVHSLIYTRNEDDLNVDENGEIVERGTAKELISLGGRFASIYRMQTAGGQLDDSSYGKED